MKFGSFRVECSEIDNRGLDVHLKIEPKIATNVACLFIALIHFRTLASLEVGEGSTDLTH